MKITERTENALIKWLSAFPESNQPRDMMRFVSIIKIAKTEGDSFVLCNIPLRLYVDKCHPEWCEDFKNEFVKEWMLKIIHAVEYDVVSDIATVES